MSARVTPSKPAGLPRNVARLPADGRAAFVATFVGRRVEMIAQRAGLYGDPETFTGRPIAMATDYARHGYVLVIETDTGRVIAFSMPAIRNIRAVAP